jgi:hypothetical protein
MDGFLISDSHSRHEKLTAEDAESAELGRVFRSVSSAISALSAVKINGTKEGGTMPGLSARLTGSTRSRQPFQSSGQGRVHLWPFIGVLSQICRAVTRKDRDFDGHARFCQAGADHHVIARGDKTASRYSPASNRTAYGSANTSTSPTPVPPFTPCAIAV